MSSLPAVRKSFGTRRTKNARAMILLITMYLSVGVLSFVEFCEGSNFDGMRRIAGEYMA